MTKSIIEIERERHAALAANRALNNNRITLNPTLEEEDYEECCVIVGGQEWHSDCMSPAELAEFAELANACHFFN